MNPLYPKGPSKVPADLTKPTSRFKLHAWLAVGALISFVVLYFWLTGWLGYTSFRLVRDGIASGHPFIGALKATPLAFLFLFLVRGLFAVRRHEDPSWVEIHEEEEPQLFGFLHRLAAEAGAPRVHRVFLSPDVNAAVLYDLSLFNMLLPSKKNLVVGLGLLNSLTLGETKAVLAHELGHFAQKSMLVSRWVYIGQQIAGNIIASRSFFDKILDGISRIDIRIAWIGWIMKLLVWSVRAVLDTAFRFVTLSMRALSREMEYQADLVSVSLTGSDALVHALHKLHGADDAYGRAVGFAMNQIKRGKVVEDMFAVQTRMLESVRRISTDETYGAAPPMPETDRAAHRVFPERFAQPPKMWSTHPPNRDREDNAKRTYVPAPFDDRSGWLLLGQPEVLRRQMTAHALGVFNGDQPLPNDRLSTAEAIDEVDASFSKTYLDTRYKGLYLGRGVAQHAASVDALFEAEAPKGDEPIPERLAHLYPEELVDELEGWLDLNEEHATLIALKDGFLTAPGGLVRYRGEEVRRRDLGRVIERVDVERDAALERVLTRDRECRTLHRDAARLIGNGWEQYHRSLVALLHYAEHTEADLRDVDGFFLNVFHVVIADGRVSNAERRRLVSAAADAYDSLARVFSQKDAVYLPDAVSRRLDVENWAKALGDFNLGVPTEMNIGDWMQAADSWLLTVAGDLGALRACTLEVLLDTEEHIARCARGECEIGEAPTTALVPGHYETLVPGRERERQKKLDFWDRFMLAEGIVPGAVRLAVAGAILGAGFWLGGVAAVDHSMVVYNGLDRPVDVFIGDEVASLRPASWQEVDIGDDDEVDVRTITREGAVIEEFEADVSNTQAQYVYNVASASPLVEWTAVYGSGYDPGPEVMGTPRVATTDADYVFTEPPRSASGSGSGTTKRVLAGFGDADPLSQISALEGGDTSALVLAHARWDAPGSTHLSMWMRLAQDLPEFSELLAQRLDETPDVILMRLEQDAANDDAARAEVCRRQRADARISRGGDAEYLEARCNRDARARRDAYLAGYQRFPSNPFFARAAGSHLAGAGLYEEAASSLEAAQRSRSDLAAEVAVELARVRRVVAHPNRATMHDLLPHSSRLQQMQGLEERADWTHEGIGQSYGMLADGRYDAAVTHAYGVDPAMAHAVLRLAAASEGAPQGLVERAHGLAPRDGLTYSTLWSALALAMRDGRDATPLVAEATEMLGEERVALLLGWADPIRLREDLEALEEGLSLLDVELRGQARVMGIIALGADAPDRWRQEAEALLFSMERPRLTPPPEGGLASPFDRPSPDDPSEILRQLREELERIQ